MRHPAGCRAARAPAAPDPPGDPDPDGSRRIRVLRAGQFLHLAVDPYDPSGFWPDSRVFSIASPPASRDAIRLTYAVHGPFTERMEREAIEGRHDWVKMPYGDFVIDGRTEVVLFAGGTGVTAFTAFLEDAHSTDVQRITLAYGARTADLLIYREVVERCAQRTPALSVICFAEDPASAKGGRVEQALLLHHREVEHPVADRNADMRLVARTPKDAIGQVLNREMRFGRHRDEGMQGGVGGGVHG